MISDWRTYSVEDFVPFTPEVYFRLIERVNEAQWPLHLVVLAAGIGIVALLLFDRGWIAGALLAAAWIWSGVTFLLQEYADLNWAGSYFGWAFCIQGVVLLSCGLLGRFTSKEIRRLSVPSWAGFALLAYGLVLYPLLAPLLGEGWAHSELFGIHPDPTATATLGLLLVGTRGWSLWISSLIPILWCVIAGLTLHVLEAPWAASLPVVAAVAFASIVWRSFQRKEVGDEP